VVFSPDGKRLTSSAAGSDQTIRIWDLETGNQLRQMSCLGHRLALDPNGHLLASVWWGKDSPLRIWDTRSGAEGIRLDQTGLTFSDCVAFSPDGKTVATGHLSGGMTLWDVATGQKRQLQVEVGDQAAAGVYQLAYSPDGDTLATAIGGTKEIPLCLWDVKTGKVRRTIQDPSQAIAALAFSRDGKILAVASADLGTVRLYDSATGRPLRHFQVGPAFGIVRDVVFTPDGRRLVTLNGDGTAFILRLEEP
jgi:WD40 repeat protein